MPTLCHGKCREYTRQKLYLFLKGYHFSFLSFSLFFFSFFIFLSFKLIGGCLWFYGDLGEMGVGFNLFQFNFWISLSLFMIRLVLIEFWSSCCRWIWSQEFWSNPTTSFKRHSHANLISKDSTAFTEVCSDRDKLNLNFPQGSRIYHLRSVIRISII